ncbi:MAG TPA: AI-2E family transporter, partial [Saprospiraceae bacterium]|nr:AI-2E family transporter [Saprospiraceae bacterium]
MGAIFNNRIRQVLLLAVIIGLFVLLVSNLYAFVPGMLGAITLYILSRTWYDYLTRRKHWNKVFTAILFMLLFIIGLGIPIYFSIDILASRVNTVFSNTQDLVKGFYSISRSVNEFIGFQVLTEENIQHVLSTLSDSVPGFLNSTIMILANLAMLLFIVFFMFVHEEEMAKVISGIIPLRHRNIYILSEETKRMIRANAIGIPLISIIQGLFATLGYWLFDVPQYGMWGFLT